MPTRRRSALAAGLAGGLLAGGRLHAAAPPRGGQVAGWYRFRLGGFECTVVSDGALTIAPPHPTLGGEVASAAQVRQALQAAFLPTDAMRAQLNCLVVNTGRALVLIDAGVGPQPVYGPGSGRLGAALAAAGIARAEIDLVAFTHGHADHCWGIADAAGEDVFPMARYGMSSTDFDGWTNEALLGAPAPIGPMVAGNRAVLLPRRDRFALFGVNAEIVPGIRALPSPGHTPGHVCFLLESEGERLLVAGDIANHAVLSLRHPDWPFIFDSDPAMAARTRRRVLAMAAAERLRLLGYHFPWPGLGHVEAQGEGFVFHPSPWEWG